MFGDTIVIPLRNIKYALTVTGGGWSYSHSLYLITDLGYVYYTENWKAEDVIPTNSIPATFLSNIDPSKEFKIPKDIHYAVMDACDCAVFDHTLDKPIYNAFGEEDEFKEYFDIVFKLRMNIAKQGR